MSKKPPRYYPPPDSVIERFAREVCDILATKNDDPEYASLDTINGLSTFIKIAARTTAKRLNSETNQ